MLHVAHRAMLIFLISLFALFQHTSPANAQSNGALYPVPTITALEVAAVVGTPPSATHLQGTLFLGWADRSTRLARKITIAEWGIAEQKLLARRVIRTCKEDENGCTVRLARSADRVVALTGGYSDDVDATMEVISLGLDLSEIKSRILGKGATPILDADGRFILAGAWEETTPVLPATHQIIPPRHVLSMRVLDPMTLQTVGSRVFRGTHLLSPNLIMARTLAESARLGNGGAWIALPDDQLHVLHVQIPSLTTNVERVFPRKWDGVVERTQAGVEPIGTNVLVIGDHALRLLSPSLKTLDEKDTQNSSQYVYDTTKGQLFSDAFAPPRIGNIPIRPNPIPQDTSRILWAFGRCAMVAHRDPNPPGHPSPTPEAHWGVAVFP